MAVLRQNKTTRTMKKTLNIKHAHLKFQRFLAKARILGFFQISEEREGRDLKMQGIVAPDSPRIADLQGQVKLEKQIDDYTIRVITTFDPKLKKFTKAGKFWVRIVTPNKKTGREPGVFTWKTTRTGDFLGRALLMMEYLSFQLELRPYDENRKLMKLVRLTENKSNPYMWAGSRKRDRRMLAPLNHHNLEASKDLQRFIHQWKRNLWYYENVVRPRKGYQRREKYVRKPYTVQR